MPSKLDRLKALGRIGAEDASFDALRRFRPSDCAVGPKLVLDLFGSDEAHELVADAMVWGRSRHGVTSQVVDRLLGNFAVAAGRLVPGAVSIEIDADLAFDPEGMAERARAIVAACEQGGLARDRVRVGLAATWEGIQAAAVLQAEGIGCILTLVFSLAQAAAAAEAGAPAIATGLHADARGAPDMPETPDLELAGRILGYYAKHGLATTLVVGSFAGVAEIERLAGVVDLALPPRWLDRLAREDGPLATGRALEPGAVVPGRMVLDQKSFRFMLNEDGIAAERLAGGVREAVRRLRALRNHVSRRLEDVVDPLGPPMGLSSDVPE